MKQDRIVVSSVTYAIKGRDLLRSKGFKAYIERSHGRLETDGCGYSIYVDHDTDRAEQILRDHHIRVVRRMGGGA
ncbi:MAG: DUF3343 domain-containing protein [Clostridia bacterium]|nr:DUF3343 domain-containing protein [Clostridia bacterium]